MELKQLEAFVKVVETQNFSEAARLLFLTQPTVSAHIASLEKEFQTKLLIRTTKHVGTTPEGELLYEHAKEMLEIKGEIEKEFHGRESEADVLFLSASTIPSLYVLPELIASYQKKVSGVQFHITQTDSAGAQAELLAHKAELAFIGMPIEDERLHCEPFMKDKLVIITPNEEKYQKILNGTDVWNRLLKEPIILRESGSGTRKEAERFLAMKGIKESDLHVAAHINDQETIKHSVSKGMGISIISKKAAEDYAQMHKILLYEPGDTQIWRNLYIAALKNKKQEKKIKKFVEFTMQYFKEQA